MIIQAATFPSADEEHAMWPNNLFLQRDATSGNQLGAMIRL